MTGNRSEGLPGGYFFFIDQTNVISWATKVPTAQMSIISRFNDITITVTPPSEVFGGEDELLHPRKR